MVGGRYLQNHEVIKYLPWTWKVLLEDKTKEAKALIDPIFLGLMQNIEYNMIYPDIFVSAKN